LSIPFEKINPVNGIIFLDSQVNSVYNKVHEEAFSMEVGELISYYRKQAKMTIDELALTSGVPKGTLNKIIGGVTKAPTLDNMKSIAKALGKTLADFDDPLTIRESPGTDGTVSEERTTEGDPLRSTLLNNFDQLNQEGKEKLVDLSDDMVSSGKYIKSSQDSLGREKMA